MVNFCGNMMWLIRQAIPPGASGKKKKEQGQDQESRSVTVNEIGHRRKQRSILQINELIDPLHVSN